jgi:CheY-like chemotaxis protein
MNGNEKRTVMVIDDAEDFCEFVKVILEATGDFQVTSCYSGRMAVRQAERHKPDIILLDMMMPEMDGSEVASALKADNVTQDIPIAFVTSLISERDVDSGQGIIDGYYFVAKPVQTDKLINVINTVTLK